jgi:predicted nucleotidyltransferase
MWEGGGAAFGRLDDWSDIDLMLIVDDPQVENIVKQVEAALRELSPIELKLELPQPSWHGHWQAYYRFTRGSPYLVLDLVVMQRSSKNRFLEPEIHGEARVIFDKEHYTHTPLLDRDALSDTLSQRLNLLYLRFELFQSNVEKSIKRKNDIEALTDYFNSTLGPLVEVLRILHCPARYSFGTRHIYHDLPQEELSRLEPLFYVTNREDVFNKRATAEDWFRESLARARREYGP